jgi:hypothetical protein
MNREKILLLVENVAISLIWLRFLAKIVEHWRLMSLDARESVVIFLVFFSLWWLNSARDQRRRTSLGVACIVILIVYRMVWVLK